MALDAAATIKTENSVEKLLAHQMALAHEMIFRLADRAMSCDHRHAGDQVETCRVDLTPEFSTR